jgi:DNA-binding NarL/FixJ family response regulator
MILLATKYPGTTPRANARRRSLIDLISRGFTNAQIARELSYSEAYVKKEIYRLMQQHRLSNRAHLVGHAYREGWLSADAAGEPG